MRDASVGVTTCDDGTIPVGTVNGHAIFLSSCESLLGSNIAGDVTAMEWVHFCTGGSSVSLHSELRSYLTQNLFRHVLASAEVMGADIARSFVLEILSDFQWLRGRIAADGRASVVLDCALALGPLLGSVAGATSEDVLFTGRTQMSVRALRDCLMLVGDGVSREADGTLASSLVQLAQSSSVLSGDDKLDSNFINILARSAERKVLGPWQKPIRGCARMREQGSVVRSVVGSGARVWSLAVLGDGKHFVSGSADGVVLRVHDLSNLEAVLELRGHADNVNCVAVAQKEGLKNCVVLFSGSDDGSVRSWEVALGSERGPKEKANFHVGFCESSVWCLSVSSGGNIVAGGCEDGRVLIWKWENGDVIRSYTQVSSFSCSVGGQISDWVREVAVSVSGSVVVSGSKLECVSIWSCSGCGIDGEVELFSASCENGATLRSVLLSGDESYFLVVYAEPAGFEVWGVDSGNIISPRVGLPDFNVLNCAALSSDQDMCVEGSVSRERLLLGGWNDDYGDFVAEYSSNGGDSRALSRYFVTSRPRSVFSTVFAGNKRLLVSGDDGCVRLLGNDGSLSRDGTAPHQEPARVAETDSLSGPPLEPVQAVVVMAKAGFVVTGHRDGRFSLWQAVTGKYIRIFYDRRGDWVNCIDVSADESVAVSGHRNRAGLVWDTLTWQCRFEFKGHSGQVAFAMASTGTNRIVTVDEEGELRVWADVERTGEALLVIATGLPVVVEEGRYYCGSRGAISLDGGRFLWASKGGVRYRQQLPPSDRNWLGKVIDLKVGDVLFEAKESFSDWTALLDEMNSQTEHFGGQAFWRFGAVYGNRLVELPVESENATDLWRISSGTERGDRFNRVECEFRRAGGAVTGGASIGLDGDVLSIAAKWVLPGADGRRRAIIAGALVPKSAPVILHLLIPAKDY